MESNFVYLFAFGRSEPSSDNRLFEFHLHLIVVIIFGAIESDGSVSFFFCVFYTTNNSIIILRESAQTRQKTNDHQRTLRPPACGTRERRTEPNNLFSPLMRN